MSKKPNKPIKEDMATLQKTHGADSLYQRMTGIRKSGKKGDKQKNAEDVYDENGWTDDPSMESNTDQKDRFQKQKVFDQMMENRRKKLGLGKLDKKAKK